MSTEEIPTPIRLTDDGWEYRGQTYRTLTEAAAVYHAPTLLVPHVLASLAQAEGERLPAHRVLSDLADAMTCMIRPTREILVEHTMDDDGIETVTVDEDAERVNNALLCCIVRLREDATALRPPTPISGGF